MRIKVDALDYAMREMLSMKCENRQWRLVAFLSKSLKQNREELKIHNKEMLVVIRGIGKLKAFIRF